MQKNYNENLVAGAAIRDDKGRRISKLFESPHPKMTVGYAKNLIMPDTPTEQEFNFRKSGGGVIEDGVAVIDKVKGNSVVWNQLIKDFREPSNWLTVGNDVTIVGDKIHIKFTSTSPSNAFGIKSSAFFAGHKYYIQMNNENAVPLTAIKLGSASSVGNIGSTMGSQETPFITDAIPTSSESDGTLWFWPSDETKLEGDFSNIYAIDLTQMFGAGNEPSTYEEFLQRKPKVADEYAYNEGEIINNKVEKVVTTGRNLWDEEWENGFIEEGTGMPIHNGRLTEMRSKHFIPIIGGQNYYMSKDTQAFSYEICWFEYDANFAFLGRSAYIQTLSAKSNTAYVRVGLYVTTSGVTVTPATAPKTCINLSDPTINGQYFPYEKHELDLSWVKEIKDAEGVKLFEDGMKSARTAFDEVGKNKAVKRIEVVDLGELEWKTNTKPSEENEMMCRFFVKPTGLALKPNYSNCVLSPKFGYAYDAGMNASYNHTCFSLKDGRVFFNIALAEVGEYSIYAIRNYMQGVPLYYELAEPIVVEYDEKNLTYPVVAVGTEEAIASEPSTAFRADIGYGIDAVKTILDLKARVKALEEK